MQKKSKGYAAGNALRTVLRYVKSYRQLCLNAWCLQRVEPTGELGNRPYFLAFCFGGGEFCYQLLHPLLQRTNLVPILPLRSF